LAGKLVGPGEGFVAIGVKASKIAAVGALALVSALAPLAAGLLAAQFAVAGERSFDLPFSLGPIACWTQKGQPAQLSCRWDRLETGGYRASCDAAFSAGEAPAFRAVAAAQPVTTAKVFKAPGPFTYRSRGITCELSASESFSYECNNDGGSVSCTLCINFFGQQCYSGRMSIRQVEAAR